MIEGLFKASLSSKLHALLKTSRANHFQCGRHVHCHISPRPKGRFGFSASIVTNNASLGDVSGVYHFFSSSNYATFREALLSMTAEIANASLKLPRMLFFRIFGFCTKENVDYYLSHYKTLTDRDGWLEKAVNCDWKERHHFVREQFETGSWTPHVTEQPEVLHLLSDEIQNLDAQQ